MRTREEIGTDGKRKEDLIIEVLLDIRDALLEQRKPSGTVTVSTMPPIMVKPTPTKHKLGRKPIRKRPGRPKKVTK